jgi:hypothetical protein
MYGGGVMIRFMLRFVGLVGIALAFILLVYDGANWIENKVARPTTIEWVWNQTSAKAPQDVLRPLVAPLGNWLWDPVLQYFLAAPAALVLAILGAVLMLLGRKKRPLIGYGRDR